MSASATGPQTRLAEIMDGEGRKWSWLSERTGIARSTLSHYGKGLHVPDDHRQLIAAALEREVAEVFPPSEVPA